MPRCLSKHEHPSKIEADDCNWLLSREQAGEVRNIKLYKSYPLYINGKLWKKWKPDFTFEEFVPAGFAMEFGTGYFARAINETKGYNRSDASYRLKLHAFMLQYPGVRVYVNRHRVTMSPDGKRVLQAHSEQIRHLKAAKVERRRRYKSWKDWLKKNPQKKGRN